jgi:hypothetical protein
MGAYTCEFGVVHKVCRCPTPHTIKCDKVAEHSGTGYVPKHRAEPVVKFRITVMESERGWGRDEWTEDYDTREEAQNRIDFINGFNKPGPAPDYYMQAYSEIKEVTL